MNYYWVDRFNGEIFSVSSIEITKGKMGFKHAEVVEMLYKRPTEKDNPSPIEKDYLIKVGFSTTLLGDQVLEGEAELFNNIFGDKLNSTYG